MKMNIGVWIGLAGGLIGLIVGVGAVYSTAGIWPALGMLAVFGGMFLLFYKLFFGPMLMSSRLQKTGTPGKALIKEVHDTGVTINNNPQVKLVVDVKNYLGQTYTATMRVLVSRINPGMYQAGMTIPVKIDPKNENNVVLDLSGGQTSIKPAQQSFKDNAFNTSNATAVQGELEAMAKRDDEIRLTGTPARAIISSYTWLGVYVNGNNPYAELEIEVLPDNEPAFHAKVKGVIGEQAVAKFQPGKQIYVKYDPNDHQRVAMDHS